MFIVVGRTTDANERADVGSSFDEWKGYFECPHWLNVCFVDYDEEGDRVLLGLEEGDDAGEEERKRVGMKMAGFAMTEAKAPRKLSDDFGQGGRRGAVAAAPRAPGPAERAQGNAGGEGARDFHEVLAAVRPQPGGVPKALIALLGEVRSAEERS